MFSSFYLSYLKKEESFDSIPHQGVKEKGKPNEYINMTTPLLVNLI